MTLVHESGAFAVAMDIDAAGLPFLKNMEPPSGSKTVKELREIIEMAGLPMEATTARAEGEREAGACNQCFQPRR